MKFRMILAAALICAVSVYADAPKGTVPRASADSYPAHTVHDGLSVGATLLTADQVRKAFASDLNRCCLVVEVAFYPEKDNAVTVSLNDFALRVSGSDIAAKPSTAEVLAAKLQKKSAPSPGGGPDVGVYPTVGVGYETGGIDPVTGQRRPGGVVTSTGVGVGVGIGGPPTPPGASDRDRRTMELELSEKGLPEGQAAAPVSGYVYFAMPPKKDKKATHQLEYMVNGEKIVLNLP